MNDIDFIVGALLEMPAEGAKVGPTARCIIADNFNRYKIGDRFFYDVPGQPGSFTPGTHWILTIRYERNFIEIKYLVLTFKKYLFTEQLQILKYMNLGHVICATSNIQFLPKDIFMPLNSR